MSKPSRNLIIRGRYSQFIDEKTDAEKAADIHTAQRGILPSASKQTPCEPVPREQIKKDFEEYKEYIRDEFLRTEAGDDIIGRIALGQLYEDTNEKVVEGDVDEKLAQKLRTITAKLKRNKKFKKAIKSRKITKMEPKTVDELLDLIPNTEEFNCIIDPSQKFKHLQPSTRGGKNKRKTNKRKTRRY